MNKFKNKQGGFIQIIILVIVVVCVLYFFHVSIADAFNWIVNAFQHVFS